MYKRQKWRHAGGRVIEIIESHDGNHGAPGQPRQKKRKPTPEEILKMNRLNRERVCLRKLLNNFGIHDYYCTLTYRKDARPVDMTAAKKDFADFIDRLRRRYKKAGVVMKWIRNIEVGSRGAWHVHVVLNRIKGLDILISELWKKGRIDIQLIYQEGNMKKLAAYLTKSPVTDPGLKESHYWTSRGLTVPEPTKKIIKGWKLTDAIRIPKGYALDKESYFEGVNAFGFAFRSYLLEKIERG